MGSFRANLSLLLPVARASRPRVCAFSRPANTVGSFCPVAPRAVSSQDIAHASVWRTLASFRTVTIGTSFRASWVRFSHATRAAERTVRLRRDRARDRVAPRPLHLSEALRAGRTFLVGNGDFDSQTRQITGVARCAPGASNAQRPDPRLPKVGQSSLRIMREEKSAEHRDKIHKRDGGTRCHNRSRRG